MSDSTGQWQAAHDAAVAAEFDGYIDPTSGLFVMTSAYLLARGTCCSRSCRHCPYGHTDAQSAADEERSLP